MNELSDVELAMLRDNVATYKSAVLEAMRRAVPWPCDHCGQPVPAPADGWWTATQLAEATRFDGPTFMIALNGLVSDGTLTQDSRFRMRLADAR